MCNNDLVQSRVGGGTNWFCIETHTFHLFGISVLERIYSHGTKAVTDYIIVFEF